jgi:hypothetical protein
MTFSSTLSQLNAFFHAHKADSLDPSNLGDGGSDASTAPQASAQIAAGPLAIHGDLAGASAHPAKETRANDGQTIIGTAGGLRFDLIWDNSVVNAPSQYKSAIEAAAQFYSNIFSNNDLITIHIGWGEVDGQSLGADALGENIPNSVTESYKTVYNALWNDSGSSSVQSNADGTLPGSNPLPTSRFSVSDAQAQAWGALSRNSGRNDGWMGLANNRQLGGGSTWDFSQTGSIGPNQFDAITTAEHELSELMGRYSNVGQGDGFGSYSALDLFRYSTPGRRDLFSNNGKAYFSIDKGVTNLGVYNNNPSNGDLGDWTGSVQGDSYGDGYPGEFSPVTKNDLIEDAVLGYTLTAYGKTQI